MRIAVFKDNRFRRAGVVENRGDDAVISPLPADTDVLQLLEDRARGERVLAAAGEPVPLSRVRLLAPVLPPTVWDFLAFEEHTVQGIGSISTTVVRGVAPVPVPAARHRLTDRAAR